VAALSKSITVRLCKQTEYTARLETKSRRMLRQMRHMYNDIASHTKGDKDDLVGYDCSKFPWFKHMLPAPARPFNFTLPAACEMTLNPFTAAAENGKITDAQISGSLKRDKSETASLTDAEMLQQEIADDEAQIEIKRAKLEALKVQQAGTAAVQSANEPPPKRQKLVKADSKDDSESA
jgi:hypothetical protein